MENQPALILFDPKFKEEANDIADALEHVKIKCDQKALDMNYQQTLDECKLPNWAQLY